MRIAVVSNGPNWSNDLAEVFGRCRCFLLYDEETRATEVLANPGAEATGGSGIEAAQLLVDESVDLLVAPKLGPKAHKVLSEAGIHFSFHKGGKAGDALAEARREAVD